MRVASSDFATLRARAEHFGQGHLFAFWERISAAERKALLGDVARIDFPAVAELVRGDASSATTGPPVDRLAPAVAWPRLPPQEQEARYREALRLAEEWLRAGRVAAMTVAGGQGTRLGFDGPKGALPISPVKRKPLFQIFAEMIRWAARRYGATAPWYIMTSPATDAATREFFARHENFGLAAADIFLFEQGVMPALSRDGQILLDGPHRVALSPDGHGGSLTALARSGALDDMRRRGVDTISYFQVDNPLVQPFDRLFLGLHAQTGSQASSLTLRKADDFERVGNFALADGKLGVVEYSDLPADAATARTPNGERKFDLANIAVHIFAREFLEELTGSAGHGSLPWHRAIKRVPYIDVQSGERVEPDQPNAIKLERFVFDALPLAERTLLVEADRAEVFSPVKNATGVDSVETAQRDMVRRAARWLEACGGKIPRRADGEPDCVLEISPLLASDAESLRAGLPQVPAIGRGQSAYVE